MKFSLSLLLLIPSVALAQVAPKAADATVVPFKLSRTQHVVVRVKIDGKGPFNFVIDTGCPILLISTEAAKKAGLTSDKGMAIIDKLEFEGGLVQEKVKARVETPFQIEGMNAMGLPGMELHGLMGYTALAKHKIEIDLGRERMTWTPLAFDPPGFDRLKLQDGGTANIEVMGSVLKVFARLSGLKPGPPPVPRGFAGIELEQSGDRAKVTAVLAKSPAEAAGLKVGDELDAIGKKSVATVAQALAAVAEMPAGQELNVSVLRAGERTTLKLKLGSGF
jgi:membrane-associated protease RseP (regulator of RpoE activity)